MERVLRRIGIQTTDLCQLKCDHCPKRSDITNVLKDIEAFKDVVNMIMETGLFVHLDVTPIRGEPFTDATMVEKLEWLETTSVKRVKFITNLIDFDREKLERIFDLKCIKPHILFYGSDRKSYDSYTNTEGLFPVWEENLSILKSIWSGDRPYTYFHLSNYVEMESKVNSVFRYMMTQYWENTWTSNDLMNRIYGDYIGIQIIQNGDIVVTGKYYAVIDNIFKLNRPLREVLEPVMENIRNMDGVTGRYYSCGGKQWQKK